MCRLSDVDVSAVAFSANLAFNASAEIADSINYPNLRFWTAANVGAATPASDIKDAQTGGKYGGNKTLIGPYSLSSWAVSAPAAFAPAGGPTFTWPSAICYFCACKISPTGSHSLSPSSSDLRQSIGGRRPRRVQGARRQCSDWPHGR